MSTNRNEPILLAQGVHKAFGSLPVLQGIDLTVQRGETVAIIGPSGSGKSTFLRCLAHLERIDRGLITIEGAPIAGDTTLSETIIRQRCRRIGMVFQNFNLFPHRTALENVIEGLIVVRKRAKKEAITRGEHLLEQVGLSDKRDVFPSHLSGGQKQRVAIARMLALEPDIMLFDEPTSALDPELVGEVLSVIQTLATAHMTMVIVTHEMGFARELSNRVVFMDEGKIIADEPPSRFFSAQEHPRIKAFLEKIL